MKRLALTLLVLSAALLLAGCGGHMHVATNSDTWMVTEQSDMDGPATLTLERCTQPGVHNRCDHLTVNVGQSCYDSAESATEDTPGTFLNTRAIKKCLNYKHSKDRQRVEAMLEVPAASDKQASSGNYDTASSDDKASDTSAASVPR